MFCPECGSKNDDNAIFCENCGIRLQTEGGKVLSSPVKKDKEPMLKGNKALVIEAIVMIVCLVLCFVIYGKTFSPECIAEKYIEAKYNQDWNKVYDVLEVNDAGKFASKEAFVTAQQINVDWGAQDIEIRHVEESTGSFGRKKIIVRYSDENSSQKEEVIVKRHGFKWKIATEEYVCKNFSISVPKGAKVTVDKIDVSDSMEPSDEIAEMDTYTLNEVFGARHYVEISGDDIEKTQALVSVPEDGTVIVDAGYNEKIMDRLAKQASEDMKEVLEGAATNKRFSEIEVFKGIHKDYKEDAIDEYESLRKQLYGNVGDSYRLEEYSLSNLEAVSREVDESDNEFLEIQIKGDAHLYSTDAYWDGERYDNISNGNCSFYLYYGRMNGEWKLSAIDVDSIY